MVLFTGCMPTVPVAEMPTATAVLTAAQQAMAAPTATVPPDPPVTAPTAKAAAPFPADTKRQASA